MYIPKKILITGGCGFIASHVIIHLVNNYPDYMIVNVDRLSYCSSLKNLSSIENKPNYKFYLMDITSVNEMEKIFEIEQFDTIMHFAAQTHVDNSFGNSFKFIEDNIKGTHVLLELAKKFNIKRFIHVSTDEVYGETDSNVSEHTILNPTNPYAASKAGAELLVNSYNISFKLPTIITRGNNVFGPHQYPEKLIPKFINMLNRNMDLPIHGSGEESRNFIYIDDVVSAFEYILHTGKIGEIYNIGTDYQISNNEVADKLIHIFGDKNKKYHVENRCFNDKRYLIDNSKLKQLGWNVRVSFDEGLSKTVEWYNKNIDHWGDLSKVLVPHPRN